MKKAVVLVSGGVDSAVTLYLAKKEYECNVLIFDYGQRARKEIDFAKKIADSSGSKYYVLSIELPWKGSALVDRKVPIPRGEISRKGNSIPDTYVPARNIIFLSFGVSFAEAIGAETVFIGAHQLDYSNYPDCRQEFFDSYRETIRLGTKMGTQGREVKIITPIINKTKKEIIELGSSLGVPFEYTWSCYENGDSPCGVCESCLFRIEAFEKANIYDASKTS